MVTKGNYDSRWDEIYGAGQMLNRYPWDMVVSFVFRYGKKFNNPKRLLELGCGAGSNLIFAATEGYKATGIDGSAAAIDFARQRFQELGLEGNLEVCLFDELPFDENSFEIVIDRGALTCTGYSVMQRTLKLVHKVLSPEGIFLFTPFSKDHSGYTCGNENEDKLCMVTKTGIADAGHICFLSKKELLALIDTEKWNILFLKRDIVEEFKDAGVETQATWIVGLEKKSNN